MNEKIKNIFSWTLLIVGFILIVVKAIDYLVGGESLVPGLTLIGLIMVAVGLFLKNKK